MNYSLIARLLRGCIFVIFFALIGGCNIYRGGNLFVLEDNNSYAEGDVAFRSNEVYFLKSNRINTNRRIINKRINISYNNNSNREAVIKKLQTTKGAFHFSIFCDGKSNFLKSLPKVDSIFVIYNYKTKKREFVSPDVVKQSNSAPYTNIFKYYIYKIAPCSINGKIEDSKW